MGRLHNEVAGDVAKEYLRLDLKAPTLSTEFKLDMAIKMVRAYQTACTLLFKQEYMAVK